MANIMKMGAAPGFLGSWDLEDHPNREITLTIDHIVDEKVTADGRSEVCTVVHWREHGFSPMILNITNKKALAKLYKTVDTEKLRGKSVVIGSDKVKAFGDIHDALRIRPRIPHVQAPVAPKCENCGKDIAGAGKLNPEQMAEYTRTKYGKRLCAECATVAATTQGAQVYPRFLRPCTTQVSQTSFSLLFSLSVSEQ